MLTILHSFKLLLATLYFPADSQRNMYYLFRETFCTIGIISKEIFTCLWNGLKKELNQLHCLFL